MICKDDYKDWVEYWVGVDHNKRVFTGISPDSNTRIYVMLNYDLNLVEYQIKEEVNRSVVESESFKVEGRFMSTFKDLYDIFTFINGG